MLKVVNLSMGYGSRELFSDLSFEVPSGTGLRISGPNGVGKSSLLSALSGDTDQYTGEILLNQKDISEYSVIELSKIRSVMLQRIKPTLPLKVAEFLKLLPFIEIADSLIESFDLDQKLNTSILNLSGGELQRIFFLVCIRQPAELYILDEPISSQDELGQHLIEEEVLKLIDIGKTVIIASHINFESLKTLELK